MVLLKRRKRLAATASSPSVSSLECESSNDDSMRAAVDSSLVSVDELEPTLAASGDTACVVGKLSSEATTPVVDDGDQCRLHDAMLAASPPLRLLLIAPATFLVLSSPVGTGVVDVVASSMPSLTFARVTLSMSPTACDPPVVLLAAPTAFDAAAAVSDACWSISAKFSHDMIGVSLVKHLITFRLFDVVVVSAEDVTTVAISIEVRGRSVAAASSPVDCVPTPPESMSIAFRD